MAKATKAQIEAVDKPVTESSSWSPGLTRKGIELKRVIVYCQDSRCTIKVKQRGEGDSVYTYQMASRVPDYTAKHFGMEAINKADLPEGVSAFTKGSKNGVSFKVPWMEGGRVKKSPKGNHYLVSIPVSGNATIPQIFAFINTEFKTNKPSYFISPRGAKYDL